VNEDRSFCKGGGGTGSGKGNWARPREARRATGTGRAQTLLCRRPPLSPRVRRRVGRRFWPAVRLRVCPGESDRCGSLQTPIPKS